VLIVDAHEDLAWNRLTFNRDYTKSAAQTRRAEAGGAIPRHNDDTLLGWPEYQRGGVAVIFATLFAAPLRFQAGEWDTQCYTDANQANRMYQAQLDLYERLVDEHEDKFRMLHSQADLRGVLTEWEAGHPAEQDTEHSAEGKRHQDAINDVLDSAANPVGLVILMEGAEAVRAVGELDEWWARGVRIIGPAWSGNRFCGGSMEPGPLTPEGFALLEGMADLGFGLDLSHMDEKAALQALDVYSGPVMATHSNALALLRGSESNRHLSDRLIRGVLEREGVIGVVPFNAFLKQGWRRGDRRELVTLDHLVAQIDYICQMAGNARHAGIGSDFDGGFGLQSIPLGLDSIADLPKLAPLLAEKGYSPEDSAAILGGNWLARLEEILPESA
jgi:membrane dipeptidase